MLTLAPGACTLVGVGKVVAVKEMNIYRITVLAGVIIVVVLIVEDEEVCICVYVGRGIR